MEKRINKYLSEIGYCSRREADRLIKKGEVTVNDVTAVLGTKVNIDDIVTVNGKIVVMKNEFVYLAFNKPKGITSTTDREDPSNLIDYIKYPIRIFHVGRLDKDSEGLLFLTNDGDIVNKILRSGNNHEKEYVVKVDKQITPSFIKKMAQGVPVLDKITKECYVEKIDEYHFRIVLTEGMNRQIRRMTSYLGYQVIRLMRVRIMNVTIDGIKPGKWRYLTTEEVEELQGLVEGSSKTEEASTKA